MYIKMVVARVGMVNCTLWLTMISLPLYFFFKPDGPAPLDPIPQGSAARIESEERKEQEEIVVPRRIAKIRLAEDLIAGRRTLFEAAALAAALNRIPPEVRFYPFRRPEQLPAWFEPRTEEDWMCLIIMNWIDHDLNLDSSQCLRDEVRYRLRRVQSLPCARSQRFFAVFPGSCSGSGF